MAASGGGLAPSPPKRPTIIRPGSDAGPPVPSRPAPPVPGGARPAPAVPHRPNDQVPSRPQPPPPSRPDQPVRPQPPPPSRPAEVARPQPPPPSRPDQPVRPQPPPPSRPAEVARPQPPPPSRAAEVARKPTITKPPERPSNASVKKRPEITIVSARPMSEIGFRDSKPEAPSTNPVKEDSHTHIAPSPTGENISTAPGHAPAPVPRASPRGDKHDKQQDSTDSGGPSRGAPPPVPRHSLIRNHVDKDDANTETEENIEEIKTVPNRGPPPPVPRPTIIKPNVPPSVAPGRPPPSLPGRPPASPKVPHHDFSSEHISEQKLDDNESHHISPPKPGGAPPAVPRHPSLRNKLPSPLLPHKLNYLSGKGVDEDPQNPLVDTSPNTDSNEKAEKVEDVSELYAVINKPKRPTIIRPGRPSVKSDAEPKLENEVKTAAEIKTKISPTPRVSRNIEKETELKVKANLENNSEGPSESNNDGNTVPEFLRKKLKPTVDVSDNIEGDKSGSTAGGGPNVPLKPRPLSSRGPPPATKPKPSVLPKPQVAAKPQSIVKANETGTHEQTIGTKEVTDKIENDNQSFSTQSEQQKNEINTASQQVKPMKRPTIIRPSRSVKSGSVENVCQENNSGKSDSDKLNSFRDDSAIDSLPRLQPPLPNKRPSSMINIHKAVENEDTHISENLVSNSSKSSENVSETLRPKPSPRPAARSRPVTMIVPPVSRPPFPSAGPTIDQSSLPPRPQGRPPTKPPAPETDQDHINHDTRKESTEEKPSLRVQFGVTVLPRPETDHSGPPKPVRRPPPPKTSPRKSSESSDDEEFVTAKEKPDRPSAGPARKGSVSARKDSSGDELKKPPRPGAPPPPTQKDDHEDEQVKKRPPKPEGRPHRPMSMPVKQSPPSQFSRQKPPGPRSGKKGVPPLPQRPKPGHPLYYHMMQVPHGIAVHDYTALHDDELSLKTGDLIIFVRRVDSDWVLGKVDEREGMFPQDFVKVKMPFPGEKLDDDNSSNDSAEMFFDASTEKPDNIGHGPRCRARFDFDGEGPYDLTFEGGDVIRLIERVGLEWRKGEIKGRVGLFPLPFVEIIEELPEEEEKDTGSFVKAIFDFEGEEGDLNFQAGDCIKVTHMVNEEWLYGETGDRTGQFPVQFVEHVPHGLSTLPSGDIHAKGDNYAKGDHFTEMKAEDKLTNTLAMWDDHEDHKEQAEFSGVTSTADRHTSSSEDLVSMATSPPVMPYCIALYDYPAQTDEDLGFSEGDHIEIIERISADWLKGKTGGKIGMFPSAFVDVKVDMGINAHKAPEPIHEEVAETYGVALYEFSGEAENELTFHTGDRFVIQDLVEGAEDWRWGIIDGHRGMFPAAFVEVDS